MADGRFRCTGYSSGIKTVVSSRSHANMFSFHDIYIYIYIAWSKCLFEGELKRSPWQIQKTKNKYLKAFEFVMVCKIYILLMFGLY